MPNHPVGVRRPASFGSGGPAAYGEGLLAGVAGEICLEYLPYPLVMLGMALYTACRAGRVHRLLFLAGSLTGFLLPVLKKGGALPDLAQTAGNALVPLAVVAAYYLFSGAHFFAVYAGTRRAWAVTAGWAALLALWVAFIAPSRLAVMLTPLLWLCFLPLWAARLRAVHSLLFALVYLTVLSFTPAAAGRPEGPLWAAVGGMALIPELLGRLYPTRTHPLDSLPVITPTLGWREKWQGMREVLFLLVDFYALAMEKYQWWRKLLPLGRAVSAAGLALAAFAAAAGLPPLTFAFALALAAAGLLLLLGGADYAAAGFCLGLGGVLLAAGKGFFASSGQPAAVFWGLGLFLLGAALFLGRPRETKQEREKWRNLNSSGQGGKGLFG